MENECTTVILLLFSLQLKLLHFHSSFLDHGSDFVAVYEKANLDHPDDKKKKKTAKGKHFGSFYWNQNFTIFAD